MIIDNSCLGLANTQDERFTPFWLSRSKGMTVDIWIRILQGVSRRKSLAGVNINIELMLLTLPQNGVKA
jgi:hypothetical protein